MLLSNRHQFLFVHLAKTGGTSIRAALGRYRWLDSTYWPAVICHRVSRIYGHRIGCRIPRHAPIVVAKGMLPPPLFASLFKFGFVRNPWDRLVSAYCHFQRERTDILRRYQLDDFAAFAVWLMSTDSVGTPGPALIEALRRPQLDYLVDIDGSTLVDFVGCYENLDDDFQQVLRTMRLPAVKLPHKRRGRRPDDYRLHYSDQMAERVARHFAVDLEVFGYQFDTPAVAGIADTTGHAAAFAVTRGKRLTLEMEAGYVES